MYLIFSPNHKSDNSPKRKRDVSGFDPAAEFPNNTNIRPKGSIDSDMNSIESM